MSNNFRELKKRIASFFFYRSKVKPFSVFFFSSNWLWTKCFRRKQGLFPYLRWAKLLQGALSPGGKYVSSVNFDYPTMHIVCWLFTVMFEPEASDAIFFNRRTGRVNHTLSIINISRSIRCLAPVRSLSQYRLKDRPMMYYTHKFHSSRKVFLIHLSCVSIWTICLVSLGLRST